MDLVAIIAHNRSKKELLRLPTLLNQSSELKALYSKKQQLDVEQLSKLKKCKWAGPFEMTEENLLTIWTHLKKDTDITTEKEINYDSQIETYFGDIEVYEKTINITPFPEHKYRNLRNPTSSKYIFQLNRVIAKIIGSAKIVYCCDSYYQPSIIDEKAMLGWNLRSIIEFADNIFGIPPKEINEAVENLYFIDELDINLEELDPDKKVWSRASYEYEKKQKNEPPYNKLVI